MMTLKKRGGRESGKSPGATAQAKQPAISPGAAAQPRAAERPANPAALDCESGGLNWSHIEHDHEIIRDLRKKLAEMENRPVVHIIEDARQWGYDGPVVEVSTPTASGMFGMDATVLGLSNWLARHAKEARTDGQ